MSSDDGSRTRGIEFGALDDLDEATFPMDKDEFLDAYGDHELDLEGDTTTLREALGPLGETTFESVEDVERGVLTMVGEDAVGREEYSDRSQVEETDRDGESI